MNKTLKDIAWELLNNHQYNNGYGIKAFAVMDACKKYNVEFKDLFNEIVIQAGEQYCDCCGA